MSEPTPDDRAAMAALELRISQLAAFAQAANEEARRLKAEWKRHHVVGDQVKPPIPDGSPRPPDAASIRYKHGASKIVFYDQDPAPSITRGDLFQWLEENRPEEIEVVERIRPSYLTGFVNANGVAVSPHGDIDQPGVTVLSNAATVEVEVVKANRDQLFASMRGMALRELLGGSGLLGEGAVTDD